MTTPAAASSVRDVIVSHDVDADGRPTTGRAFGPGFTIAWAPPSTGDEVEAPGAMPAAVIEAAADRLAHLSDALGATERGDAALAHLDAALALLR